MIELPMAPTLAMNDYQGIEQAALNGLGIAEIPSIIASDSLKSGRLVPVLTDWSFRASKLSFVYSGNRAVPQLVHLFKAHCLEQIKQIGSELRLK